MKIPHILLITMFLPGMLQCMEENIRQIDNQIAYLRTLYTTYRSPEQYSYAKVRGYSPDYGYFKHPLIAACIVDIQDKGSLDPFFTLWNSIKAQPQVEEALLEECTLLSITFFNNVLNELSEGSRAYDTDVTVDEIIALYNRLAAMPLSQLIQLLNGIVDYVVIAIKTTPYGQILFAWLKGPWWEPVVMIGGFVIKWLLT